jgi:hypothetical protein
MANRYWRGGNGTWDNTPGTKWSATSGGAGGAPVPTDLDNVFFNNASGAVTVTWAGGASPTVLSINNTNFTGTHATGGNTKILAGTGAVWISPATCTITGAPTLNVSSIGSTAISVNCNSANPSATNSPNFNFTGGTYALTLSGNSYRSLGFYGSSCVASGSVSIYSNLGLSSIGTGVFTGLSPTFVGSSVIGTGGKSLGTATINGSGITVTLTDNLNINSTAQFILTQGTINLDGFTINTPSFSSSNTNIRSIAFGSTGKIQLNAIATGTIWDTATVTNFTYTGTSNIEVVGSGNNLTKTINTGSMAPSQALNWTINEYSSTTANTVTFAANNAVNNLTVNTTNGGRYQLSNSALTIYGNYSYGGTYTPGYSSVFFNGSTDTIRNLSVPSQALNLSTGDWTIEAWIYKTSSQQGNILSLVNATSGSNVGISFQTSAANTFTQNNGVTATVNSGTFSLNTWTHIAAVRTSGSTQLYLNGVASGAPFTQTPSPSQYFAIGCTVTTTLIFFPGYISNLRVVKGVSVYTGNFTPPSLAPLATSGAASAASYPSTTNVNTSFESNATSLLACQTAMDMVENSIYKFPITVIGNPRAFFLNPYNLNVFPLINSGANAWTFASTGTQTLSFNGLTHDVPITINGSGGTVNLQTSSSVGITRTTTLTNGTLNLNGYTFISGLFATGAGTKNITFDGGDLVINGSGAIAFNNANPSGFTTTQGTSAGTISMINSSAKTFVGGGSTFNCTLNQGGAGALTISGANTFANISNTYKSTGATTITFPASTTTTVSAFTASGEAGRVLTINSTGLQATLSKASGTVSVNYCSIFNSAAIGGATWEALTTNNNTDGGGNTGWVFSYSLSSGNMFLMFS